MARPISTSYSDEEKAAIIAHVLTEVSGGRAVSRIMREDEGMPAASLFWKWHLEDSGETGGLQDKLARARENGVESVLDETIDIADDGTNDYVPKPQRDGDEGEPDVAFDRENVLRSKLRVETRQKYAQMIAPRKYGPKLDLTSDGKALNLAAEVEAARRRAAKQEGEQ